MPRLPHPAAAHILTTSSCAAQCHSLLQRCTPFQTGRVQCRPIQQRASRQTCTTVCQGVYSSSSNSGSGSSNGDNRSSRRMCRCGAFSVSGLFHSLYTLRQCICCIQPGLFGTSTATAAAAAAAPALLGGRLSPAGRPCAAFILSSWQLYRGATTDTSMCRTA